MDRRGFLAGAALSGLIAPSALLRSGLAQIVKFSRVSVSTWPNASNTGVPGGTKLTPSGRITISADGATVSAHDISGDVLIDANNVVLKNCKITNGGFGIVKIERNRTGITVQDCEINGVGTLNDGSNGIWDRGSNSSFLRNNIYNVENGIVPGDGDLIQDNYIHDLIASGSPHYDGIQIDGGANITIRHNTIINSNGSTSCVMIDNYFGAISNIIVENNLCVGGAYTIFVDGRFGGGAITGVQLIRNQLGKGRWGYIATNQTSPVLLENFDYITGQLIPGQHAFQ